MRQQESLHGLDFCPCSWLGCPVLPRALVLLVPAWQISRAQILPTPLVRVAALGQPCVSYLIRHREVFPAPRLWSYLQHLINESRKPQRGMKPLILYLWPGCLFCDVSTLRQSLKMRASLVKMHTSLSIGAKRQYCRVKCCALTCSAAFRAGSRSLANLLLKVQILKEPDIL